MRYDESKYPDARISPNLFQDGNNDFQRQCNCKLKTSARRIAETCERCAISSCRWVPEFLACSVPTAQGSPPSCAFWPRSRSQPRDEPCGTALTSHAIQTPCVPSSDISRRTSAFTPT